MNPRPGRVGGRGWRLFTGRLPGGLLLSVCFLLCVVLSACASGETDKAEEETSISGISGAEPIEPILEETDTTVELWTGEEEQETKPAEITETDPVGVLMGEMTLRDKLAQMMVPSFRKWAPDGKQPVAVTELEGEVRELIAGARFGGVVLFAENCVDAEQTLRLVSSMQTATLEGGGVPLFVCTDQEGGRVTRLSFGTTGVGNRMLAATGDPENARLMAAIHGKEIGLLGMQVDLAPVLDVNNNPLNPVIGVRSFSDDPQIVAEYGLAYMEGLHQSGIIPTLKHFPGHGNTDTDSHTGLPVINCTYEELKKCELVPFQAAIDAGAEMVMTAHIQFPEIEKETCESLSGEKIAVPATMSRVILTDILRGDMGFTGVVMSDALDMAAVAKSFRQEDVLRMAINAGVDLLLLPPVWDEDSLVQVQTLLDTAVALAESGEIETARIEESVRRILALKQKYGLLEQTDFSVTQEQVRAAQEGVGSDAHRETERQIALKAQNETDTVILGDEQTDTFLPLLKGKRVALFTNQTGIVGDRTDAERDAITSDDGLTPFGRDRSGREIGYGPHILDALQERGISVEAVFSPEHGFRGTADAGEQVGDSRDGKTGVPVLSLVGPRNGHPTAEDLARFDVLVVDLQDVGLRFYTHHILLYYLMDACAQSGKEVVVLDRPNPNGYYVDGPVLEKEYRSGVGQLPIPVVHGMTLGELAQMINGEGWLASGRDACRLTVIPCRNYSHRTKTSLVLSPSPNLKDMRAVYLYASTCFFENTVISVGRGTTSPFEVIGCPALKGLSSYTFSFTPVSMEGAKNPPYINEACYGRDLRDIPLDSIRDAGIDLTYLIEAFTTVRDAYPNVEFFGKPDGSGRYYLDLLSGSDDLRRQIIAGKSAEEIKASWQDGIAAFLVQRRPYLLYEE